ncbi:LOW QUALITY PROTEIN: hypothetical protein Cgig2_020651 [Carnegiea gigantea]|uniref:Uncharacterized protein n=1 Tax=Carnegiea gigantea TaxID=171969 RepID=A0A9Q1QIZ8_9CARY|nr:LOW QUALITY PROTEIN: hypothetical protein Cgig2_020651 [Carnegiea gigantea]
MTCLEVAQRVIQRDEGPPSSKRKLKIISSQKPLRPPILAIEDNIPQIKIQGVGVISVTSISVIPIQSVAMLAKALNEVRLTLEPSPATACRRKLKKAIFLPPDGVQNIMDILDCDPSPTECMDKLAHVPLLLRSHCFPSIDHLQSLGSDFLGNDLCPMTRGVFVPQMMMIKLNAPRVPLPLRPPRASQDVSVFNIDAVIREVNKSRARMIGQVVLDKVFCAPFKMLHCHKGEFNNLYDLINKRGGDATPLKSKVERLIHQARDLKDLQQSYSNRMTSHRGRILNEASQQLDVESTHYNALKAKLGQVESGLIDLQGWIDTLNAIKVIDPATKASLERTEAYVKECFEDLKTFQWTL